jgi:hypothetical protein
MGKPRKSSRDQMMRDKTEQKKWTHKRGVMKGRQSGMENTCHRMIHLGENING